MVNFPSSSDTLTDPTSSNTLDSPDHAGQHADANNILEALEAKLGTGASTPTDNKFLIGNGTGTSAWSTLTSAQLIARISDETGSGALVFGTSPTIATPTLTSPVIATSLDMNGTELILDADADTSIAADTDDQIDIKISNADDFQFTANTFNVLNGSTLDINASATLDVDPSATMKVDTISENTAANGVSIDSFAVKDGLAVGGAGTGVANSSLSTTAGDIGGAWTTWSPTYENITVGSGTVTAKYTKIGKTIIGKWTLVLAADSALGNSQSITVPTATATYAGTYSPIGTALFYDISDEVLAGVVYVSAGTTNKMYIRWLDDNTTAANQVRASGSFVPTEANTDQLSVNFTYEAA